MSDKLTGPEAMIALMQGKTIQLKNTIGDVVFVYFKNKQLYSDFRYVSFSEIPGFRKSYPYDFCDIIGWNEWELVPEPRVWEGVLKAGISSLITVGSSEDLPEWCHRKQVKVRLEEIL